MRSKGTEHLRGAAALGTASPNLTNRGETTPAKRWCQGASGYSFRVGVQLCSGIAFCRVVTRLVAAKRNRKRKGRRLHLSCASRPYGRVNEETR
jgi:hypothetical protein